MLADPCGNIGHFGKLADLVVDFVARAAWLDDAQLHATFTVDFVVAILPTLLINVANTDVRLIHLRQAIDGFSGKVFSERTDAYF